jgi:hypothetical protein
MAKSTKKTTTQPEPLSQGDYTPAMLYVNIFAKNYICVTRHKDHMETNQSSEQIIIGSHWKPVVFPTMKPLFVADDFKEFRKIAAEDHGGLGSIFNKAEKQGVKVYVQYEDFAPFFYYFLSQLNRVHKFDESLLALIIKKTNERFWIWEHKDLNLSLAAMKKFEKSLGPIPKEEIILTKKDPNDLPIEYLLALYFEKKVDKSDVLNKFDAMKKHFVALSMVNVARRNKEIIFNNPKFMKSYNGFNIDGNKSLITELSRDAILNRLFVDRIDVNDVDWAVKNQDKIKKVLTLLRKSGLESNDSPEEEELSLLMDLFYGKNQKVKDDAFARMLDSKGFGVHELSLFDVYHDKINTTMLNYLSVKYTYQ